MQASGLLGWARGRIQHVWNNGQQPGVSATFAAHLAALIFLVGGTANLLTALQPTVPGIDMPLLVATGAYALLAGVVVWLLPWARWSMRATLWLVPLGLLLVALSNVAGGQDPWEWSAFFIVVFAWIGICQSPGTSLRMLAPFVVAYLAPLFPTHQASATALSSVVFVGFTCVVVGESLAWVSRRWRGAEAATELERRRLELILEHADDAVVMVDPQGRFTFTNPTVWRLFAATKASQGTIASLAELRKHFELRYADGRLLAPHESPVDQVLAGEAVSDLELAFIYRATGDRRTALLSALPVHDARGTVMQAVVTLRDITERKAGEEALRESELRLRTVVEEQNLRARRLASLLESSRAIASAGGMEEALAIVTRSAVELFDVSGGIAYEYDAERDAIAARAMWERTPSGWDRLGEFLPLESSVERKLLDSGGVLLERLSDPDLDAYSRATMEKWGEKSCLTVPMPSADGVLGLLAFWDEQQQREYSPEELALATSLAELAGEAVRSAKLLRRLQDLSETDSLTGLANHRKLCEFLTHEQARTERYGSHFSLVMLDLDEFKLLNDTHGHPAGDAVLRQVAALLAERARAADVVGRYGGDEFLLVMPETTAGEAGEAAEKLRAALAERPYLTATGEQIPIRASFGIAAYPDDVPDANGLVAIADANLYASKRRGGDAVTGSAEERLLGEAEGSTFDLFESLVTAVDNKDRYTRRHSEEVTEYALAIAAALGLSDESQRVLRVAALLHDVGKIGIPDRILRKPGRLSETEHEIMKGHSLLGETIIAAIPDVAEIRAAVVSHHERYDGAGYPHGLAKDAIPLLGRIMAVADTYSAMTTDRPYRAALSRQETIAELQACSGTQFDPRIVEAFISCIEPAEAAAVSPA